MDTLAIKVEPPFSKSHSLPPTSDSYQADVCVAEYSIHQMHQDVAALSDELLAQTLPPDKKEVVAAPKKEAEKDGKAK